MTFTIRRKHGISTLNYRLLRSSTSPSSPAKYSTPTPAPAAPDSAICPGPPATLAAYRHTFWCVVCMQVPSSEWQRSSSVATSRHRIPAYIGFPSAAFSPTSDLSIRLRAVILVPSFSFLRSSSGTPICVPRRPFRRARFLVHLKVNRPLPVTRSTSLACYHYAP